MNAQEICRTAGFWGTHAAVDPDKPGSTNITEEVMKAWLISQGEPLTFLPGGGCVNEFGPVSCNFEPPGPAGSPKECREAKRNVITLPPDFPPNGLTGLNICGQTIFPNPEDSQVIAPVVEALCVSPKGDNKLQLARQLTAAALNCIMSGGGPTCEGTSIAEVFDPEGCNDMCGDATSQRDDISLCIEKVDCFNNGRVWNQDDPNAWYCQSDVANSWHDQPLTFTITIGDDGDPPPDGGVF